MFITAKDFRFLTETLKGEVCKDLDAALTKGDFWEAAAILHDYGKQETNLTTEDRERLSHIAGSWCPQFRNHVFLFLWDRLPREVSREVGAALGKGDLWAATAILYEYGMELKRRAKEIEDAGEHLMDVARQWKAGNYYNGTPQ